jgi:hypothetical protein
MTASSICGASIASENSYVDGPRVQGLLSLFWRYGQVQSYVRPFGAVHDRWP